MLRTRSLCLRLCLCALTSLLAGACAKAAIDDRGRDDDDADAGPLVKPELPDAGGRPERPDAGPPPEETDGGPADGGTPDGGTDCPTDTVNLLKNGDFEDGPGADWVEISSGEFPLIVAEGDPSLPDEFVVTPASAPFMVYLGGYDNAVDRIQQDVAVPPEATDFRLAGAFRVDTEETSTTSAFDNSFLEIVSTEDGTVLEELANFNNLDDTDDEFIVIDVAVAGDYAGQTVRFQLRTTTDVSLDTDFFFDSLVLEATACAGDRK